MKYFLVYTKQDFGTKHIMVEQFTEMKTLNGVVEKERLPYGSYHIFKGEKISALAALQHPEKY